MVSFFPGCVSVRDAEATGCCTNPLIPSAPLWGHPGPGWAVVECIGNVGQGDLGNGTADRGGRAVRNQAHPGAAPAEQGLGVDVFAVEPDREVEGSTRDGDDLAPLDLIAPIDQQVVHEADSGTEPAGMVDAHEQVAGDCAGERNGAGSGGRDPVPRPGRVLDAAIARPVGPVGQAEGVEHRRGRRPAEHDRRGRHRWGREQHDDERSDERPGQAAGGSGHGTSSVLITGEVGPPTRRVRARPR